MHAFLKTRSKLRLAGLFIAFAASWIQSGCASNGQQGQYPYPPPQQGPYYPPVQTGGLDPWSVPGKGGQVPGQLPIPGQIPGQFPGQIPTQFPGQIPGQFPGQFPGQYQYPPVTQNPLPWPDPNQGFPVYQPPFEIDVPDKAPWCPPPVITVQKPHHQRPHKHHPRPHCPKHRKHPKHPKHPQLPQIPPITQLPIPGKGDPFPVPGQIPGQLPIPGQIPGQLPIPGQIPGKGGELPVFTGQLPVVDKSFRPVPTEMIYKGVSK